MSLGSKDAMMPYYDMALLRSLFHQKDHLIPHNIQFERHKEM